MEIGGNDSRCSALSPIPDHCCPPHPPPTARAGLDNLPVHGLKIFGGNQALGLDSAQGDFLPAPKGDDSPRSSRSEQGTKRVTRSDICAAGLSLEPPVESSS